MKALYKFAAVLMIIIISTLSLRSFGQTPTYSCVATNDTLLNANTYQFDIYIYRTGTTDLYLNNYQLSFEISNTTAILNGGVLSGSYVGSSTELPASFTPGGVSILTSGSNRLVRINGPGVSSNGALIPTTGLRIGTFQIVNTVAFGQSNMGLIWWNTSPATTVIWAIVPPAPTGPVQMITTFSTHTTIFTDPLLNVEVTAYNITGGGSYCAGGPGLPVGLDGSQTGVMYKLLLSSVQSGPAIPGTGSAITFGNQLAGTYTSTGYRKATYLTADMNGTAIITEDPSNPVSVSISESANPVCEGTLVTFTATPTNGGTDPAYQWKVNGSDVGTNSAIYSYTPADGDIITCILTSNEPCPTGNPATSNAITMTVNPQMPVSVSISASENNICAGTSVTFTATPTNGGATPAYQWKVNGSDVGTNSTVYSYIPVDGDVVTCILTSNATCATGSPATSNAITMTVNPQLPVSVSISASANPVCAGTTVTFTATPTNGGTSPTYQWKVNGVSTGTNSPNFSFVPATGNTVACQVTSSEPCATNNPATSNLITMTVNPDLPVSISISPSGNPVCAGTSVTFTATPVNGGTSPVFQWKIGFVPVGTNSPTYTYVPSQGDIVSCMLFSNATCAVGSPATSNVVTMMVNSTLPVSVFISASNNNICEGTTVTYTATPSNGGTTPAYQWKVNGVDVGTNSNSYSYAPVDGDVVTCVLTSNATCATGNPATSNAIAMTVNPILPVSVSIEASDNNVCAGTTVTYTATPTNGGTTPAYQWKVNGSDVGTNSAVYSYAPANGDVVTCVLTSNANCKTGSPATSNAVTMTVNPLLPVSVSISASDNNICAGTSVTFTATPTNGGTTPAYQWKVNGTDVGTNSTSYSYVPVNGDVVTCNLTSNAVCPTGNPATSNSITMTVNPVLPVSVNISPSENPVCSGTTVIFTATPTNGGTTPAYQWKVNGSNVGINSASYSYAPVNEDVITCVLTSNATCATGNPATSNSITMTVSTLLPVSVSITASANPVCTGTSVDFTAVPTNGGTTPAYQWKVNGIIVGTDSPDYSYTPVTGDVVTCQLTSNVTCATGNPATSNAVTMTVNPLLPVSVSISASDNNICAGTSVTFTATPTNGGTTPAYQWKVNGVSKGTNSSTYSYAPVDGDVVTCVLTSNAVCPTGNPATSNAITMTVNPLLPVSVSISASENNICAGTSVTFTATPTNGGAIPAYQWKVNGSDVGINSNSYSYAPVDGDVVTCILTSNAVCPTGNPATSNAITMIVNPLLPVSVSISASDNNICAGTSVTFTATPTNGGITPAYQWKVNGVSKGTNSPTYSYAPVDGDVVTCVLTSNAVCSTGNPATSNAVTMTVNPLLPVSVSISASDNNICAGTSVTFTATPTNGGTIPAYQWKVNGTDVGTNSNSYSYAPVDGDVVTCVLTSNAVCPTGNPATSNAITMTVNPLLPVSVSISASDNNICAGTSVTFTSTPTNGGTSPAYQWKVNGVNKGTNSTTYSYAPVDGDVVTCVLTSNAVCPTGNPATSNTITMTVNPLLPVSVNISPSENPVCSGTTVIFTATPTNGGTTPAYQWKVNGSNVGINNASYSYAPADGDVVTCILTSNTTCPTGNPATSNSVTMTVSTLLPVSVSIAASDNNICAGTSVTYIATPTNGGTTPAYQWKVNGVNVGTNNTTYSYAPVDGDVVTCILTSNATCATSNPATSNTITMTVNPLLPVSVSISASDNNICAGTSVTFTATPTNGGTIPAYQWKVNGTDVGTNSNSYSYAPVDGDVVTCVLTSNAVCPTGNPATSNAITMTVNPLLPVSVSISASDNNICAGTSVTFTATPTNGGTAPAYQWKVNGVNKGTNSTTYSYAPVDGDVVTCVLTSNAVCPTGNPAISNAITMTVNPLLPVSVSISASDNNICAGTSVTFTATPTNGGTTPAYQWKVNGVNVGTNSTTYSYAPVNGDVVTCILTSNAVCPTGNPATSNAITMTVNPLLPVSVSISASDNNICAGTSVTFTATPTNGGTTPAYQWKVNGVSKGTNSSTYSYAPADGDVVTCVLTSNAVCPTGNPATSNAITMTVNPLLPVSVSISASDNNICAGTSVTFTATPTNGGTTPAYQWKVNGVNVGINSNSYSYAPVDGDVVTCVLTSNAVCATGNPATSNAITMTVNPLLPVSVSISASDNNICAGTSVTFTATPTNGGTTPAYQWKVNGVNVGINSTTFSYAPVDGDVVTCVLTSNAVCPTGNPATSNAITMIVNPLLPVSVSISASDNNICAGTSVTFTATPTNGGTTPAYQWKVNGVNVGINSTTYSYVPVNGDVITCVLTSNATCATGNPATSNAITMTVNPLLPVSVSIAASDNNICAGTSVTFTATPTNGGTTPAYQWKVNGSNVGTNSTTYSYAPVDGDVVTCALTSNAVCPTGNPATSNAITMTVNPLLPVSVSITASDNNICTGTSVTFTATPTNGGTTPAYQWKVNGSDVGTNSTTYSYIPVNGDVVTCVLTSNATCATGSPATSNSITMTVNPLLPVSVSIAASDNNICAGTSVTFTATPTNGGTTPAYQWKVNGINAGTNSSIYTYAPVNGDEVTCVLTSNAVCPTGNPATSNAITMIVNTLLPVSLSITASDNNVCTGTIVTFTATPTNGGTNPSYQWKVGSTNVGSNSNTYSYVPTDGDVVTCILTSNALCPSGNPATSNAITMIVTPLQTVSVSITVNTNPVCDATPVTFTAVPVNGGTSPGYQWKVGTNNVGTNSPTFTYLPVDGDVVTCVLTSNATCISNSLATSNPITMSVVPLIPVSVSISASDNNICSGTLVTYTATPTNGGTVPGYQWKVNGINAGTNNPVYTYAPNNGDVVTCVLTSNISCPSGNPATSNAITMTVYTSLPVSVSISASDNNICAGTSVTFTATPTNGGTAPAYQWKVNGSNVGTNSTTYSYVPVNGDVVTCVLTSNITCPTGNPATSNTITMTVNPILPVSVSITASDNNICDGTSVTFTATPTNGGSLPGYQWKVNGLNVGINSALYTYVPVNGDIVTCVLTSNVACPTGNPATSNAITMTVNPLMPVSISISASDNNICAGTSVTFTATPTNEGTTPVYQWKVNGVNVGTNSTSYSYVPLNGDVVTCVLTSNVTCATPNPATSNAITMTVNPLLPVSISISADQNPACSGALVTFTATPTNGGTTPAYQWKVNGTNVGTNSNIYSYVPVNGDEVTCVLTSNAVCPTGNPATSNTITMTVNPLMPVSISISASDNNICAGTLVTFTATPTNGGTTPAYQWKVNGINAGTNSSVYTYAPADGDVVTCVLTSNATCATGNPATSNAITMTVNPQMPVSISISASDNNICAGTSVTFTATPTNGGTTPVYQWKVNGINVGTNSNIYSYVPVNGDIVTCVLTSNVVCPTGNPATSNAITMTVNPLLPVSISISADQNPVCSGTLVTFTATPTNGGTTPAYQWKVNGINAGTNSSIYTYAPANGDVVTCILTSNATCATGSPATSNTITMTVDPLMPVSISISASDNNICAGTLVTFTATPTNGGTTPAYQWKVNGINAGTNSSEYTYAPANGDVVTCVLTSNATCATGNPATSNAITMTVNPQMPVSVSISASDNNICAGTSVTFTATPTNEGTTPVYQWKVNGINVGTNSNIYSYVPVNGDVVTCILTSNITCATGSPATSNAITMTVNPLLPVSISISADQNPACSGTLVTFTATPTNGGTTPVYQWKVNGTDVGTNSNVYSYNPANGDVVTCILTSNATCATGSPATSNTVTMTVNPILPVSVSISASDNNICAGTLVTFTATPTNGGTTPAYQWKVNGINAGTNSSVYTYAPADGDVVTCVLTSNATCATGNPATSNTITMTVNPQMPVSVSISASDNNICAGTSVTFTATPTNEGTTPVYQWKVNGANVGTNSTTYSYIPVNGDVVTCVLTSNVTCATGNPAASNAITMTVNPILPVSVSISASDNNICAGTSVTFTATPTNGGSAPAYQWKVNGINAGTNSSVYTYAPVNGDVVSCILTSNATCATGNPATSNAITMTVNPQIPVSVSISASDNNICAGTSVTFTATPTNGGTTPVYQWKVNGLNVGTNSTIYTYVPVNGDVVTCVLTSNVVCPTGNPATSNAITMTVNPLLPVSVSISADQNPVCSGTLVTFTATPTNGGTTPAYQWIVNGFDMGVNSTIYSYVPVDGDVVTCVLTSNATCATGSPATSNSITMTVNPLLPVSISISASDNNICAGTSVTFTATPTNGGTTPAYQWKVNGINAGTNSSVYTYAPADGDVVTCVLTSNATCATGSPAASNTITMTVNPQMPVSISISASDNNICAGISVTFTATPTNGGTTPVYQWKVNGVNAGTNSTIYTYVPVNGDVVTCELTSNATCATNNPATSNAITMTVNPILPVSVSITASDNNICSGTSVTFTATPVNGGTTPAYQWKVNGVNVGTNNVTYTYIPANGDVVTCVLTSNVPCETGNPATSNTITMTVNLSMPVSVSISASDNNICSGTLVTFTASPTNGGSTPAYQWKVNGSNAGTNSPSYSYAPANGDVVTCELTSSLTCATGNPATSNAITMTVIPSLPVSVAILASENNICAGTSVTFTAIPTNGGTVPAYQWKVNGINSGSNSSTFTYIPANGDVVTCVLTSNATCVTGNPATSNPVTMVVNPLLPVSVSIAPSQNPSCMGVAVVFTATPTNGGSNPAYLWKVNGFNSGTNSPVFTYIPSNNDVVTCILTSNATCATGNPATSNPVTMTTNPLPVPTISGITSLCVNSGFYNYTTESGMSNYQWSISSGGSITYGLGTNQVQVEWTQPGPQWISVNYTSTLGCMAYTPTVLNVSVSSMPGAAGSITGPTSVCQGAQNINYSVSPIIYAVTYVWSLPAGATIVSGAGTNSILVNFDVNASSGNITVYGNNLCGNGTLSPPLPVTMQPLPGAAGPITGQAAVCKGETGVVYYVSPIPDASEYFWTVPSGATIVSGFNSNSIVVDFSPTASSGTISVEGTNACGSGLPSPLFDVTVNPVPPAPVITEHNDTLVSDAPEGNQWYFENAPITGANLPVYVATQSGYYFDIVTLNGCSSAPSNILYVVITGTRDESKYLKIVIYPNPSEGLFTISITSPVKEVFDYYIFNNLGAKVYEKSGLEVNGNSKTALDLNSLPNGVYSIIFHHGNRDEIRRVMINK